MANRTRDTANLVSANNLYVDISTDRVGIGTTNPTSKLTVIGDVRVSGILTAAHIVGTSLSISGISTIANFRMSPVGTGATVGGIGVTYYGDGSQLTNIVTSIVAGTNITISGSTGQVTINSSSSGGGSISISTNTANQSQYITYVAGTGNTTGLGVTIGGLVFNPASGNLGIGTTTPLAKLHVVGDVRVSGASTFGGIVELDSSLRDFYNNVGVAGSVLISTGAGVSWSASTSSAAAVTISNDNATNADRFIMFEDITSGTVETVNVASDKLKFNPSSGTLSATVFTSLSDRTQKEDIRPIENAIGIVNQLTGVRYNWKNNTNQPSIGLIAQDVEEVIPEVVVEMADGLKSVSYGNIVAVLIEAIKEQQVRIEELEDRLNA